jgi:hypothetical protein
LVNIDHEDLAVSRWRGDVVRRNPSEIIADVAGDQKANGAA